MPSATESATALATRVLRGAEHLHRLLGALDRHLVEHDSGGLDHEIGRDDREQGGEAVLVVAQSVRERSLHGAAAGADEKVDMGDLVAFADKRLADAHFGDLRHGIPPSYTTGLPARTPCGDGEPAILVFSIPLRERNRLAG